MIISPDSAKAAESPILKGFLAGLGVAGVQFLLLFAGSGGAMIAPLVGIMLLPPALFGGLAAGLFYAFKGRKGKD